MANNRRLVLRAESVTLDAMTVLNRIRNRHLSETFSQQELHKKDLLMLMANQRLHAYLANLKNIQVFSDFLIQQSRDLSPELCQTTAAIAARKRIRTSAQREMWLPEFNLRGKVTLHNMLY